MALKPKETYPDQVDGSDPEYPQGKARNHSVPGDPTGTPLEKEWVNDLWGFQQALLAEAAIEASGNPDKVGVSQYLQALLDLFGGKVDADGGLNTPATPIEIAGAGLTVSGPGLLLGLISAAGLVKEFTPQAKNWPLRVLDPGGNDGFIDITHGLSSELWIAVGNLSTSARLLTSPDGLTWTVRTSGESTNLISVAANSSIAIFITDGGAARSSTDGATWTTRTLTGNPNPTTLHWWSAPALFVVGGQDGDVSTSPDAITWTARTTPSGFNALTWRRFASNGSMIVGVVQGSHDKCATSPDGVSWTEQSLAEAIDAKGICWSPGLGKWFIVGASGKVQYSSDGITWTAANVTSPVTFDAQDVAAHGRMVVLTHKVSNGRFRTYYSVDGLAWYLGAEHDGANSASARIVYVPFRDRFAFCGQTTIHFSMAVGNATA